MQVPDKVESRPRSLSGIKNAFYIGKKRYNLPTVTNFYVSKPLCTETNKTKSIKNIKKKTTIIVKNI